MWVEYVIRKIFGIQGPDLQNYFDDLELEKVIPQLLQYVFEYAKCQNVIWVTAEELSRIQNSQGDINPLQGEVLVDRHLKLQSVKPVNDSELLQVLGQFRSLSTMAQMLPSTAAQLSRLVVPLLQPKTREIMAFLIFLDVPTEKAEKTLLKISKDTSYMEKHIHFSMQHWRATQLSFHDDLTGLFNQRHLSTVLEHEISRAQREKTKFTVLFMDIDYFKSVNDSRGHWVGSRLLIEIAQFLQTSIRRSDYAFRYGGDEFVLVLPHTDLTHAVPLAERLREAIEKTSFVIEGEKLALTLSVGVATYPDHARTCKDIIQMADEAMYSGKHKSRNTVFVAS